MIGKEQGAKPLSITTFSKATLSMKGLFATFSITTHCHYAECHYAQCHSLFNAMLNVIMLSEVMVSVIMLIVVVPRIVTMSSPD